MVLKIFIHRLFRGVISAIVMGLPLVSIAGIDSQRQAVVKIHVTIQQEDFRQPWQSNPPMSGSGSGFIIKGKRLMTNAHVVSDARFIEVQREGDPRKFPARVRFIAHDCDIAVLEVKDESFFEGTKPLPLGSTLPSLNDTVIVLGYPMGGGRLSLTKGVVSRIDYSLYAHSSIDSHLVMQVDAAINPGNSGGPVLFNNKVIGIAFQGIAASQNIGYTIPLPVIEHFLKDIEDGNYDGYPELGVDHLRTENRALRTNLGLPNGASGVVVANIDPYGAAAGLLKPRDVLLAIDGHSIATDGSVRMDGNSVEYAEFIERKQCTENVNFTIWREDKTLAVVIPLKRKPDPFIFRQTYDEKPEYQIVGGLIFSPLSRGYLATLGTEINTPAGQHLFYTSRYAKFDNLIKDRTQFVILTGRLPHPVNTYCTSHFNQIVASINGLSIRNISDIPVALKMPSQGFHVIRFEGQDDPLIMDAKQTEQADSEILTQYTIPSLSNIKSQEDK